MIKKSFIMDDDEFVENYIYNICSLFFLFSLVNIEII